MSAKDSQKSYNNAKNNSKYEKNGNKINKIK